MKMTINRKQLLISLLFIFLFANIIFAITVKEIEFYSSDIKLSGNLYLPEIKGPFPAIVFVHGSGAETRENSTYSAKWLSSLGYAVLTYDKRGTGKSDGGKESWSRFDFNDLSNDVVAAVQYLNRLEQIDKSQIGLHAVSHGGWVASLAASKTSLISFMVMKSASVTTVKQDRVFERTTRLINEGFSSTDLEEVKAMQLTEPKRTLGDNTPDRFTELFMKNKNRPWLSRAYGGNDLFSKSLVDYRKWYATIADFDPIPYLNLINIPIFWIFGDAQLDHSGPVEKSVANLELLKDKGKEYELIQLADEGHNVSENKYELPLYNWLKKTLKYNPVKFKKHTSLLWQEDFDELYAYLKNEHRNLYHTNAPKKFEEVYRQIKKDIPNLEDHAIILQFARFVALARDGHTRLTLPLQEGMGLNQAHSKTPMPSDSSFVFRHLPVEFYWFDDGLYVSGATPQYENLIGKKVLEINNIKVEEILEAVRPYCHYDNEYGYKLIAASRVAIYEILQTLKVVKEDKDVALELLTENGLMQETIVPLPRFSNSSFSNGIRDLKGLIISRQKNDKNYWYEYLPKERAVYLQLNQINSAENGPTLMEFLRGLDDRIKREKVARLILDIRNNFGGNNSLSGAFVELITENPSLNKLGNFYTLIGRKTFSAAQYLVNDLAKWTNVIFVGEPTGASPNHYGDSVKKQLSNSNLTVRISSIYWRDGTSDESTKWTAPDIPIKNNGIDFFENKDLALSKCLNYQTPKSLEEIYTDLYHWGGLNTATRLYLRIALDLDLAEMEVEKIEKLLVTWMSKENN
jgi:pimeloyl-ACP methyl ester carboxylesterase